MSPKSKPEPRIPPVHSGFLVGGEHVDVNNEDAYLASIDEAGDPKMPFATEDIPDGTERYQKNPVYPFAPKLQKSPDLQLWLWEQAQEHKTDVPTFNRVWGQWEFPSQISCAPVSITGHSKNGRQHAIICCESAVPRDSVKNWSLYYATLNNFTKRLAGKTPVRIISYEKNNTPSLYSEYRYFFNTIGPFDKDRVIVRSFACNNLSGNDVVEILGSDCLKMCMEDEIAGVDQDDYLVRLPGVEFECNCHPRYYPVCIYWVRYQPSLSKGLKMACQGHISEGEEMEDIQPTAL